MLGDTSRLEEKAREIGRLIGQSEEYKAVRRANDALTEDRDTMRTLEELERLRLEAQRMIERGEQPSADMEATLDELLGKIQGSSSYQRVVAAQENFDKIMLRVNEWILDGIRQGSASPIITLG